MPSRATSSRAHRLGCLQRKLGQEVPAVMTHHIIAICIVLACIAVACGSPSAPPPAPTATPIPLPTVAPTDTPEPTQTPVPSPTPKPTTDLNAMAEDCQLAHVKLMAANYLDWAGTESDTLVPPIYASPDICDDFREQSPDKYARLIGNVLSGTFTLLDDNLVLIPRDGPLGSDCWGQRGYDDIRSGLGVVIKDGAGTIIAKDELLSGKLTGRNECTFPFYVGNVPDADFYAIEVGGRGSLVYSRDEIDRDDWRVAFSVGSR
jgi:hypothetical protein